MNSQTDRQLLTAYSERRSDVAFTELVRRHVDLVYSAALRMVRDPHLAEDVTQGVFTVVARDAHKLVHVEVLPGWLHRTTQNLAANAVRSDVRRRAREQEAAVMNELLSANPDVDWEQIAPYLDEALGELSEPERDAVLLRYFKNQDLRTVGAALGISDDAAQKRVSRAVERLREFFSKRGVTVGVSGLAVVISANAVQAAPVGLVVAISTAATLTTATVTTTATITTTKAIAMTALQKTIVTATIAILAGAGIYEVRQASNLRSESSNLRNQLESLREQQVPLVEQLMGLKTENERLSNQVTQTKDSQALSQAQFNELLSLRSKSNLAQTDSHELAQLKSTLAQQSGNMPDNYSNVLATTMSALVKIAQKGDLAKLARMKKMLNLTDNQVIALNELMQKQNLSQSQMSMDLLSGKITPEQRRVMAGYQDNQEAEIKALLTPGQLAAYPEFQQAEKMNAADMSATSDASRIAGSFSLSKDQQEQIRASFYQMTLNEPANGLNQEAITALRRSGNLEDAANMSIELQKIKLEEKIKILGSILTSEQMNSYREEQERTIILMEAAMKAIVPGKPAATAN